MKFKKGVLLERNGKTVTRKCVEGMMRVAVLLDEMGIQDNRACITSVMDGRHMEGSKHYEGNAFDLRTWADSYGTQLSRSEKAYLAHRLEEVLGCDWDVVIESTHIHCEYDPK